MGSSWGDYRFFNVKNDHVIITYFENYNNWPQKKDWKIPLNEWKRISSYLETKVDNQFLQEEIKNER